MSNLLDIAKELERQKQRKKDFVIPSEQIKTTYDVGTDKIKVEVGNHGEYDITNYCHGQFADKTKIPKNFYDRLKESHPELLVKNINELIKEKDKSMIRTLDGNARALLSNGYRIIDNHDILMNSLNRFNHLNKDKDMQIGVDRSDITETRLYVKATSEKLVDTIFPNKEKKEGDGVRGGIVIRNSELGHGAFSVSPFMVVLKCTNGMIADESFRKIHLGRKHGVGEVNWSDDTLRLQDKTLWSKVNDMIVQTFNPEIFHKWVDKINDVASEEVEEPIIVVNNVVKNYGLGKDKAESLLKQFSKEGFDRWGLMNSVTAVAQSEMNYENQIEMEKLGNKLLTVPLKELQRKTED